MAGEWGRGLLLEYVFLEVVTVLLVRRGLETASCVGRLLPDADELEFVSCSGIFEEAFERFTRQAGTRLSLPDAAIAHMAHERAGGLVLTFDEEFRKLPEIPRA